MDAVRAIRASDAYKAVVARVEAARGDAAKLNEAVIAAGEFVNAAVAEANGDELAPALAPAYYEYGFAALLQAETSGNYFGESVKTKEEADAEQEQQKQAAEAEAAAAPPAVSAEAQLEADETQDVTDAILQSLIEEYTANNGEAPGDEVVSQWKQTFAEAAADGGLGAILSGQAPPAPVPEQSQSAPAASSSSSSSSSAPAPAAVAEPKKEQAEQKAPPLTAEDIEDLMEVAWQTLETSRVIYERVVKDADNEKDRAEALYLLSSVLIRLGDLTMEQGHFQQSVKDFTMATGVRRASLTASTGDLWVRPMSGCHVSLGSALLYAFSEIPAGHSSKNAIILAALENFGIATEIILEMLRRATGTGEPKTSPPSSTWAAASSEEVTSSPKGKGKAKSAASAPALSDQSCSNQMGYIERAKKLSSSVAEAVKTTADASEKVKTLASYLEAICEKLDDVVELIENPEAGNAVAKAADIGEQISGAGSGGEEKDAAAATTTTTIGFGNSSNADAAPVINVLQVKRKGDDVRKREREASESPEQENSDTNGKDHAEPNLKRPKTDASKQTDSVAADAQA